MAVTLTQLPQDLSRQRERASTISSSMAVYNPSEMVPIPMPHQYQMSYSARPHDYNITSTPQWYMPGPSYQYQPPAKHCDSSLQYHESKPPPIPPKEPIVRQESPPPSPQHSSSGESGHLSLIEPDPLPPHSNPQALTQTQSQAYSGSTPRPQVRLGKDDVWNTVTGLADFRISRETAHAPKFMSTKPLLTVTKADSMPMGEVRFHTITSKSIDLKVNGRQTAISHTGLMHNRWGFEATSTPNRAEKWYWKKDKSTGGAMLEDAKRKGNIVARMKGDLLTFEKARLSQESYDEVVVSAIAMVEAARRQKRKSDIVDLASAVGDFASSDGGRGGDGGGDGGA